MAKNANLRDTYGPHPKAAKGDKGSGPYARNYAQPTTKPPQRNPDMGKLLDQKGSGTSALPKVGGGRVYRPGASRGAKRYTAT
jgi:hypothetical protein